MKEIAAVFQRITPRRLSPLTLRDTTPVDLMASLQIQRKPSEVLLLPASVPTSSEPLGDEKKMAGLRTCRGTPFSSHMKSGAPALLKNQTELAVIFSIHNYGPTGMIAPLDPSFVLQLVKLSPADRDQQLAGFQWLIFF